MAARRGISATIRGPPRISSPKRVNVCVVGAGVMGSSAALAAVRYVSSLCTRVHAYVCVYTYTYLPPLSLSLSLRTCVCVCVCVCVYAVEAMSVAVYLNSMGYCIAWEARTERAGLCAKRIHRNCIPR